MRSSTLRDGLWRLAVLVGAYLVLWVLRNLGIVTGR